MADTPPSPDGACTDGAGLCEVREGAAVLRVSAALAARPGVTSGFYNQRMALNRQLARTPGGRSASPSTLRSFGHAFRASPSDSQRCLEAWAGCPKAARTKAAAWFARGARAEAAPAGVAVPLWRRGGPGTSSRRVDHRVTEPEACALPCHARRRPTPARHTWDTPLTRRDIPGMPSGLADLCAPP